MLLGTLYPLFADVLNLGKVSVGPPFFNATFVPLMIPLCLAMPIGALLAWKRGNLKSALKKLRPALAAALLSAALVAIVMAGTTRLIWAALGLGMAVWILVGMATGFIGQVHLFKGTFKNSLLRALNLPRSFYGMTIAHAGMAFLIIGLRWGPMKPVGLTNPHNPTVKSHAVVQLRQDNLLGTLFNIVGFQTKLKYGTQTAVFKTIPGLENAEFARLGGIHRNTFINSPKLLDSTLRLKNMPRLRFAGQMTGCEGYIESATVGLLAGRFAAAEILGQDITTPPVTTAMGALLNHITTGANAETFQPMNINFGLFPPPPEELKLHGKDRKKAYTSRALTDFDSWLRLGRKAA